VLRTSWAASTSDEGEGGGGEDECVDDGGTLGSLPLAPGPHARRSSMPAERHTANPSHSLTMSAALRWGGPRPRRRWWPRRAGDLANTPRRTHALLRRLLHCGEATNGAAIIIRRIIAGEPACELKVPGCVGERDAEHCATFCVLRRGGSTRRLTSPRNARLASQRRRFDPLAPRPPLPAERTQTSTRKRITSDASNQTHHISNSTSLFGSAALSTG
jgi:hypothetical protein